MFVKLYSRTRIVLCVCAELEYAFYLEKEIISLKMEAGYKPDDWLGLLIGSDLYYDFSDPAREKFEDALKQLHSRLQELTCN